MSAAWPPVGRLWARRSVQGTARAVDRELRWRADRRRTDRALAQAGRTGGPVLVGPFLSEVGFEVLYWVPAVRRLLRRHGIAPEQVTVLTRGGAGSWYGDVAAHEIDVLDLLEHDRLPAALSDRRRAAGDQKQFTIESLDRELLSQAAQLMGRDPAVAHPSTMFRELRFFWAGERGLDVLNQACDFAPLALRHTAATDSLPDRYVALKAYFSTSFPDSPANRDALDRLLHELKATSPVVVLGSGLGAHDHQDWSPDPGDGVILLDPSNDPRRNLARQAHALAGADALVGTYGGFSYLGPFLGVPTVAVYSTPEFNRQHVLAMNRATESLPKEASFALVEATDPQALSHAGRLPLRARSATSA